MRTLTNKKIEEICQKGNHYDGDGLKLRVDKNLNKNWIVRYQINKKKHNTQQKNKW